jgi:hypothetical protein
MRRGAFAYESSETDAELAALADAAKSAAERAGAAMIKLEDKLNRQAEAMKAQQQKVDDLTGRVIRLEAQLELLTSAAMVKRLKGE